MASKAEHDLEFANNNNNIIVQVVSVKERGLVLFNFSLFPGERTLEVQNTNTTNEIADAKTSEAL